MIRVATNNDGPTVIGIIDSCLREIGDRVYPQGEGKDLLDIEVAYAGKGGEFVVFENDGAIAGTHATLPVDPKNGIVTFRRLYVNRAMRGMGIGKKLMQWAIDWSREQGFSEVVFWSDTRFTHAHEFFRRFGFVQGEMRDMCDGAAPYSEYRFTLKL